MTKAYNHQIKNIASLLIKLKFCANKIQPNFFPFFSSSLNTEFLSVQHIMPNFTQADPFCWYHLQWRLLPPPTPPPPSLPLLRWWLVWSVACPTTRATRNKAARTRTKKIPAWLSHFGYIPLYQLCTEGDRSWNCLWLYGRYCYCYHQENLLLFQTARAVQWCGSSSYCCEVWQPRILWSGDASYYGPHHRCVSNQVFCLTSTCIGAPASSKFGVMVEAPQNMGAGTGPLNPHRHNDNKNHKNNRWE